MHLFEVYANQECTERPQVGQSYERLYVKVNADLSWGINYRYGNGSEPFRALVVSVSDKQLSEISINLYTDYNSAMLSAPPVAGQVIECSYPNPDTISEPLQISFGPVAPFVHQVEIFADEECTERPMTGQSYQSLYASLHGFSVSDTMSEGSTPNSFVISQGSSVNLEYARYWVKSISRDSEIILNQVHQLNNYNSQQLVLTAEVFSFGKIVTDE